VGGVDLAAFFTECFTAADDRGKTTLKSDAGQYLMAMSQGGQLADLFGRDGRRLFDKEMAAVLDDGGGHIVEVVRRHDRIDGVGFFALEHLPIIAVAAFDAILIAGGVQAFFVEVGDGDDLGFGDREQRGVMSHQRARSGADDGETDFFAGAFLCLGLFFCFGHRVLRGSVFGRALIILRVLLLHRRLKYKDSARRSVSVSGDFRTKRIEISTTRTNKRLFFW